MLARITKLAAAVLAGSSPHRFALALLGVLLLGLLGGESLMGAQDAPQEPVHDCVLCEDSQVVACPTCEGKPFLELPCRSCEGQGSYDCAHCKKGKADCPSMKCKDGMVTWTSGSTFSKPDPKKKADKDPCRFCKRRGTVSCKLCSGGTVKCGTCRTKGVERRPCSDCVGKAVLPCPLCAVDPDQQACLWSGPRHQRPCLACVKRASPRNCWECEGKGKRSCSVCRGHGTKACDRCGATGKIRSVLQYTRSKAGVTDHEDCDGKGVVACKVCEKGSLPCTSCKRGKLRSCELCDDTKVADCRGCLLEPYRAHEVYGLLLARKAHFERSDLYLVKALKLVDVHFDERKEALRVELKDLEAKYQAAREASPLGERAKLLYRAKKDLEAERDGLKFQETKATRRLKAIRSGVGRRLPAVGAGGKH